MHWNRSTYFALSIGMMADAIVAEPAQTQTPAPAQTQTEPEALATPAPVAPAGKNPFGG
jgi:membrane-bound lytic murein transglycosylase B